MMLGGTTTDAARYLRDDCGNDCFSPAGHAEGCPVHCSCFERRAGGPAVTDFKPGDKVRVTIDGVVDEEGEFCGDDHHYPFEGRHDVGQLWNKYGAVVEHRLPAPAPYTEPRDGDELDVTVRVTVMGGYAGTPPGTDSIDHVYIGAAQLRRAASEGRVRLVKAAAPQFEAGRIYRDGEGELWAYQPATNPTAPFLSLEDGERYPADHLPDLVPCDVVPREAT